MLDSETSVNAILNATDNTTEKAGTISLHVEKEEQLFPLMFHGQFVKGSNPLPLGISDVMREQGGIQTCYPR